MVSCEWLVSSGKGKNSLIFCIQSNIQNPTFNISIISFLPFCRFREFGQAKKLKPEDRVKFRL